jgi:hypothetical protein
MSYYFWQVLIPKNNEPVKGLNLSKAGTIDFIHLLFIFTLLFIFWKDSGLIYLCAGHFLLIPFLGFIPAPFMNITWVSDQHLYLVLPALLAFWMRVMEKTRWKYVYVLPSFLGIYFSWQTFQATSFYKNQIVFYEKSLEYNPYNIPIAYNLGFARIAKGDIIKAYQVLSDTYQFAEMEPTMKKNPYYPNLVFLLSWLNKSLDER